MSNARPPSYQRFIELEDWYLINRDRWSEDPQEQEKIATEMEQNLEERQMLLWQCLKEIKDSEGVCAVPSRLISTLCYAMEDLITRGEANDYFRPSPRSKHKPKYHPIVRMAIEHAVKYILHHEQPVPGFKRENYWQDIVKTYEVDEKTARTWAKNEDYRNAKWNEIPWSNIETGIAAIEFWGEVYRSGGKASSRKAVLKKARKRAGK